MSGLDLTKRVRLELCRCKKFSESVECAPYELEKILCEKFSETHGIFVAWQVQNIVWSKFDDDKLLLKDDA